MCTLQACSCAAACVRKNAGQILKLDVATNGVTTHKPIASAMDLCTGCADMCSAAHDRLFWLQVCRESKGQCDAPETCLNGRCPTDLCVQSRTEIISDQPLCFASAGTGQAGTKANTENLMMG